MLLFVSFLSQSYMSKEVRPFDFILCYQSSTGDKYWVLRKMLLAVVMYCCTAERITHTVHLSPPMLSWGKKPLHGVATLPLHLFLKMQHIVMKEEMHLQVLQRSL